MKPGDYWVYTISGYEEYEWVRIEVESVSGTQVFFRATLHLTDGTERTGTFSVDISGRSNVYDPTLGLGVYILPGGVPPVVIGSNLNIGDAIFETGVDVTVSDTYEREYARAVRQVNYVTFIGMVEVSAHLFDHYAFTIGRPEYYAKITVYSGWIDTR